MNKIVSSKLTLVGVAISLMLNLLDSQGKAQEREPVFKAEPALKDRTFDGKVIAGERVDIGNRTNQELAIIWLVEEGTQVNKGDLLVELDSSLIEDKINEAKVNVNITKAARVKAESSISLARVTANTHQRQLEAELALIASREELLFSGTGKIATEQELLESTITIESERSQLLQAKLDQTKPKKSEAELEYLELKFQLVESLGKLRSAKAQLLHLNETLKEYEKNKLALDTEVAKARAARVLQESESRTSEAQTELEASARELELAESQLENLLDELQHCRLTAPEAGVVHYEKHESKFSDFVVEEGAMIRSWQNILYLPDLNSLQVEFDIPESVVDQVKIGQQALLGVDDEKENFAGQVLSVASLPNSVSWNEEGMKMYKVVVRVNDSPRIKIGQSINVRLPVE